jgi:hypothetical protein
VWLAEGLLFYMTEAATRELLRGASVLAAPHSQLGADLVNRDLLSSPLMWPLLEVLSPVAVLPAASAPTTRSPSLPSTGGMRR